MIKEPKKVLIGTANKVEINPVNAAPIPAIWPIGCRLIDFKLPNKKPKETNSSARKKHNTSIGGLG